MYTPRSQLPQDRSERRSINNSFPSLPRSPRNLDFSGILLSLNCYENSYSNHCLHLQESETEQNSTSNLAYSSTGCLLDAMQRRKQIPTSTLTKASGVPILSNSTPRLTCPVALLQPVEGQLTILTGAVMSYSQIHFTYRAQAPAATTSSGLRRLMPWSGRPLTGWTR